MKVSTASSEVSTGDLSPRSPDSSSPRRSKLHQSSIWAVDKAGTLFRLCAEAFGVRCRFIPDCSSEMLEYAEAEVLDAEGIVATCCAARPHCGMRSAKRRGSGLLCWMGRGFFSSERRLVRSGVTTLQCTTAFSTQSPRLQNACLPLCGSRRLWMPLIYAIGPIAADSLPLAILTPENIETISKRTRTTMHFT